MIGLSRYTYIIKQFLAKNMIELLEKHDLRNKIIAYVKDEWSNLNDYYFKVSSKLCGFGGKFPRYFKVEKKSYKKIFNIFFLPLQIC